MVSEQKINQVADIISERITSINSEYLELIGKRIKEIGELSPTDIIRLQRMYTFTGDLETITSHLANVSKKNINDIYTIFNQIAKDDYNFSKPFFDANNKKFIPFEENIELQRYVESISKQTADNYTNLTQHTAFAVFEKDGKTIAPYFANNSDKVATSLSDTYTSVIDIATQKAQMGLTSYQSSIREVLIAMADSGIKTVNYATGAMRRLDSSVRQNVLWGIKQCNQGVLDLVGEEFGADGYEISYHSNSRPSHIPMSGRQYSKDKGKTIKGVYYPPFSEVQGLLQDYNCLHFKHSILLGISEPTYTNEELNLLQQKDKELYEFEGKQYTQYEASQAQRKLETLVRSSKDRLIVAKAAGDDTLMRKEQEKINLLVGKYHKLSKTTNIPTKVERMSVSGYRKVKTEAELVKNRLTKQINNATIKLPNGLYSKLSPNTEITDYEVFAGKGSNKELRVKSFLVENYGGVEDNWKHSKCRGFVDVEGVPKKGVLHWFEEESVGIFEVNVKGWSKK